MSTTYNGRVASMGKTGKAIVGTVVMAKGKETTMISDGVLVAEMTDPNLLQAMAKSKAVVTSKGGLLCHAAIVCREMNIPCIVAVANIHKHVKDGTIITVDVTNGKVIVE